jgi:fluoride exporter
MSYYHLLVIGTGGFFGAVSRYLVANGLAIRFGSDFPYGTLVVNTVGSLLLGFLSRFLLEHLIVDELVRIMLLIGFLGSFTTFSTFSYESIMLIQDGEYWKAMLNVFANGGLCLFFCFLGLQLAKSF